jgi:hypothetical protein
MLQVELGWSTYLSSNKKTIMIDSDIVGIIHTTLLDVEILILFVVVLIQIYIPLL